MIINDFYNFFFIILLLDFTTIHRENCLHFSPEILERLARDFRLNIVDTDSNKDYHLTYPGSKTILEVSYAVFVPVRVMHSMCKLYT